MVLVKNVSVMEGIFRDTFKSFKQRTSAVDISQVLDFDHCDNFRNIQRVQIKSLREVDETLNAVDDWKVYTVGSHDGLYFIRNPFTVRGQRYWTERCLQDYPTLPDSRTNLGPNSLENGDWWQCNQESDWDHRVPKLRWTTLGYHHNWDTKQYSDDQRGGFPVDLGQLTRHIAQTLGFADFQAQAAIVNYYGRQSTIAGHVDRSEENTSAPLYSISFGQPAIFLLATDDPTAPPTAMILRSGDVLVMGGKSRMSLHAVPRILSGDQLQDLQRDAPKTWLPFHRFLLSCRINMNVRQVLQPGQQSLKGNTALS